MFKHWSAYLTCLLALYGATVAESGRTPIIPHNLTCEYQTDPLCIDEPAPRLSWKLGDRFCRQTAYRVLVATHPNLLKEGKADAWDSGRVDSDRSVHVAYAGRPLQSGVRYYWKVRAWNENNRSSAYSKTAFWQMGLLQPSDWRAKWIAFPGQLPPNSETPAPRFAPPSPSPLLRHEFTLDSEPRKATVYVTAKGLYELHLNGKRVGQHILAPEWTNYHQRIQYQAYDVTALLRQGENALGSMLGEGWYAGLVGLLGPRQYGSQLALLLQLEIEYRDGSRHWIVTDESWRTTLASPILGSDIIRGEIYDARFELPGWDLPDFRDDFWKPVETLPFGSEQLVAQPNEPIRITQELHPIAITEPQPGTYVFDMGQNLVGWCRLRIDANAGRTIQLRHAEVLNPDGTIYTKNLRDNNAKDPVDYQKDIYICRGGRETFEPHFTYHGFRYVEVTGLPRMPSLQDLTGCVIHSDAPAAGTFACSDSRLNRLMSNILWTQRGNLHSTPTDCPQRDERLGWMGDAQLFSQAACFNLNMAAFFTKWCRDIRDAQAPDGRFSDFSPNPVQSTGQFLGAPAWADAGVIVPWRIYENYDDLRILERHFDAARKWVDYVHSQSEDFIWMKSRGNDYGDWLNADTLIQENWPKKGGDTPREIIATAFFAHSTELLSKMAKVLGKSEEEAAYSALTRQIKESFVRLFVQPDGRIESDTQAIYALALHFDLLPENLREPALQHMLAGIQQYNGHLSTGIQATNRLMLELVRYDKTDEAYRLLNLRTIPSWGYPIDQGATTIWERWDGFVEGRGFQNPGMNSFNHYALGAVGEWMYRNILGIQPDPECPGFRHFTLHPRPGGGLTWAMGSLETLYGTIRVSWKIKGNCFYLEACVPPNTTATLHIPVAGMQAKDVRWVTPSTPSIPLECREEGFTMELLPGTYRLETEWPSALPESGR